MCWDDDEEDTTEEAKVEQPAEAQVQEAWCFFWAREGFSPGSERVLRKTNVTIPFSQCCQCPGCHYH